MVIQINNDSDELKEYKQFNKQNEKNSSSAIIKSAVGERRSL